MNEIVGLTIMALMAMALVDGEAHSAQQSFAGLDGDKIIEIRFTIGD